jgi:hypothetical protein
LSDHNSGDPAWDDGDETDESGGESLLYERGPAGGDHADDEIDTLMVTVTNPGGTVSATALMSGQVVKVALSPQVTKFTESQLAEEITFVATLARKQAQAAQHSFAAAFMRRLGHDPAATRALLESELGLPSPQSVLAEKAQAFVTRYQDEG